MEGMECGPRDESPRCDEFDGNELDAQASRDLEKGPVDGCPHDDESEASGTEFQESKDLASEITDNCPHGEESEESASHCQELKDLESGPDAEETTNLERGDGTVTEGSLGINDQKRHPRRGNFEPTPCQMIICALLSLPLAYGIWYIMRGNTLHDYCSDRGVRYLSAYAFGYLLYYGRCEVEHAAEGTVDGLRFLRRLTPILVIFVCAGMAFELSEMCSEKA